MLLSGKSWINHEFGLENFQLNGCLNGFQQQHQGLLEDLKLDYLRKLIYWSLMQVSCIVFDLYVYSSVYTVDVWFHLSYQLDTLATSLTNYSKLYNGHPIAIFWTNWDDLTVSNYIMIFQALDLFCGPIYSIRNGIFYDKWSACRDSAIESKIREYRFDRAPKRVKVSNSHGCMTQLSPSSSLNLNKSLLGHIYT